MKPMIPLHDKRFRYVPAANTDLRKVFDGIRWNMVRAGIVPRVVRVPALVVDRVDLVPRGLK